MDQIYQYYSRVGQHASTCVAHTRFLIHEELPSLETRNETTQVDSRYTSILLGLEASAIARKSLLGVEIRPACDGSDLSPKL